MFKATLKRTLFILLIATMAGMLGCTSPEDKRAKQLEEARELTEAGSYEAAMVILEALALDYPNDPEILQSIGQVYWLDENPTMAAFFLEEAHLQRPQDVELLYRTYQALEAAGQPTGATLEKLVALSPETMTQDLWRKLGAHRAQNNELEAALEAYLKGVNPDEETPPTETSVAIGQLFAQLNNTAQAISWFEIGSNNDNPSARTALFGLLSIHLSQKDWPAAEATLARLEKQFPGAVETSEWKQASDELKRWRAAQDEMMARLAAAETARRKAEEEAAEALEAAEELNEESENAESAVAEAAETKAQVIADLEAAEALANQPATEIADQAATELEPTIAFNPNITIEPADPELSVSVSFDEENLAPNTSIRVATSEDSISNQSMEPEAVRPESVTPPIRPAEGPKTLEELLAEAGAAEVDRDYKSAIRKYWAAISIANNRADVWNLLSRAYLVDGQVQNADTTALEAVRLSPREVAYTLDYLRVAQRSRKPDDFLAQLETAYDRFPSSPEITLSLARAYEQISKDKFAARNLYLRFVDIAPNHPLRMEAESAAERLR
ncbi:MAG: tetratricopeptide repeat protein [Opitutales bacterium]